MITKIQLAAMARVDIPEAERRDFYLYVDEFQNFATESFANILSEARKYRLDLILAHQYVEQLDEKVSPAVFGNVGTIVTFRVGAADAEFLEKEFEPVFMAQDLVNLPNFNIYVKLMIDGIAGSAFSAETLPPIDLSKTAENAEKVIKVTRERYGTEREIVEEKIARWSGMPTGRDIANAKKQPSISPPKVVLPQKIQSKNSAAKPADLERQKYSAKCATCDTDIEVPFKPDGSRPTFCKECLKDYQRQQARVQQAQPGKDRRTDGESKNPRDSRFEARQKNISLSEATRMNPRPFKNNPNKQRKQVNLAEVRQIIRESLGNR